MLLDMPAPVSSSPAPVPAPEGGNTSGRKPHVNAHSRKTRIVRRRGRAKNAIESDDDIEREVGTDSDSDSDQSSLDSDSDVESVTLPNGRSRLSTPNTTQSPERHTPLDVSPKHEASVTVDGSFFSGTRNWSEMVADENGPADLPIIDFADFDRHLSTARSRKRSKGVEKPPFGRPTSEVAPTSVPSVPSSFVGDRNEPEGNSSSRQPLRSYPTRRGPNHSARQAYQKRLDSDPSYVPTVGEFWGHDDRLFDKDLWRQSRGFYRGFSTRGQGRAIRTGRQSPIYPFHDNPEGSEGEDEARPAPLPDVAPIEQTWTHDGFEEMKRKDERRRTQEHPQAGSFRGIGGFRGGRAFNRGRGGFSRGAFTPSPTRPRPGLPLVPSPGGIWFVMKPERMWVKHHEALLYFDPALKPRRGQGRVKIPGERVQIAKAPFKTFSPSSAAPAKPSTASVSRIPKRESWEKVLQQRPSVTHVAEDPHFDDAFTMRPRAAVPSHSTRSHAVNGSLGKSDVPPGVPFSPPKVQCMARTRIPTPYGPAFLHLYHNNRDSKEHLAIVVDPAQLSESVPISAPSIRSRSLDAIWSDNETEMERITRGAYVGRLTSTSQITSQPSSRKDEVVTNGLPSPLVRIHSECFTGETVGSMRCDCGEQLDEAMRLMFQPVTVASPTPATIPGRGAIIYLRQEGRGIGLLSKIHAYNLQDIGHDTVTANIMLGHKADEREYEIACAILRDLGLGTDTGEGVQLLTNNPDKVHTLEKEGLRVIKRVPMIPRSWQSRAPQVMPKPSEMRSAGGATLMGGTMVHGTELDKYLRTKVLRMGHRLPLMEA